MPFTTVTDLITSVDNWLGQRPELQPMYPDFILLAEQRLYRDLRAREMIRRAQALLNEQWEWLPYDFLRMKRVTASPGSNVGTAYTKIRLTGMTMGQLDDQYGDLSFNMPEAYCIEGAQIRFAPAPTPQVVPPQTLDVTPYRYFETTYYARFPHLDASSTETATNAILQTYPELYLYAALIEAEPYLVDDQRVGLWKAMYDDAVQRINWLSEGEQSSAMAVGTG